MKTLELYKKNKNGERTRSIYLYFEKEDELFH